MRTTKLFVCASAAENLVREPRPLGSAPAPCVLACRRALSRHDGGDPPPQIQVAVATEAEATAEICKASCREVEFAVTAEADEEAQFC